MTGPPPPIPLEEAQARLLDSVAPLPVESVNTERALGRWLARDLHARRTQPMADLSAMDGYAVRRDDLAGPWQVIGESAAGHPFGGQLSPGEAIRISTGAHMPAGEAAVLIQENATREGDRLALNGEGAPSVRHIRHAGYDFAEGERLLAAGTRIGAAQIALALGSGHAQIDVHRLPGLALIDSGDELAASPDACGANQIPATNGAMLAALAASHVSQARRIGPVADTLAALLDAFEQATGADVIVTSGGASVGDHDLVKPALEQWGAQIDFWRVAIKPGKPLMVGHRQGQVILGLPGNPGSAYVTAVLFLLPLLRRLGGAGAPLPLALPLTTATELPAGHARREFLRARYRGGAVEALGEQDSGGLLALGCANALIDRPALADVAKAGTSVPVYLLENGAIA